MESTGQNHIKFLESERIYLRPIENEDLDLFYAKALWDQEGRRLTGSQVVFTRRGVQNWFDRITTDSSRIDLLICLQENNQPIGDIAMLDIDHHNQHAVVRIAIFENDYLGSGFGTEALSLLIAHGFNVLNLNRIGLEVYSYNERAKRAYEKVGFKQEGTIRQNLYYNGEFHDTIIMGILKSEWKRK
ncbi:GNAT family N-acetyltransferase [Aquibacillus koreensis]|uniref:GNAT family N-acetyltransferase n=2 Tax=Aquibacillus koreensis TaxID=279446 RepID=A0A9X3WLD8_9BACI|nr:GNAT family protein [Aquibacillus koreensis]MCT2537680.1 GNAT family N-acetyltransferase [Aquibacillus koreensis]MDC3420973.1 GNAT family N-acetyltransferase [Aquibacillus koreensis]